MQIQRRALLGAIAILSCLLAACSIAAEVRPNFVFILADDLGYGDLGCYGATDIKTPNLDRLAREGARLTQFYSSGPVCTPTRCALMTGRYPQRFDGLEAAIPADAKSLGLPLGERTIAEMLRDVGYATAMVGKWHLGRAEECRPTAQGFERFFGLLSGNHDYYTHREKHGTPDLWRDDEPVAMDGYSTFLLRDAAIEFIEEMRDRPFFLYAAFNAPHFPVQPPDDPRPSSLLGWAKGTRENYVKMVEALDASVGEILSALDRLGLATNTLVVFTSDNGGSRCSRNQPLSKGKGTLWEGGIRVPCIVRWPDRIPPGKVSRQVGSTMDWAVTFLNLAGVKATDKALDGLDILPVLTGEKSGHKRTLYWRRVSESGKVTLRAVRDGNWKLIDQPNGKTFLYNVATDVAEEIDLTSVDAERVKRLRGLLDKWEREVAD